MSNTPHVLQIATKQSIQHIHDLKAVVRFGQSFDGGVGYTGDAVAFTVAVGGTRLRMDASPVSFALLTNAALLAL
jgi:hypothetical protein